MFLEYFLALLNPKKEISRGTVTTNTAPNNRIIGKSSLSNSRGKTSNKTSIGSNLKSAGWSIRKVCSLFVSRCVRQKRQERR
jgi:hypothetical protein